MDKPAQETKYYSNGKLLLSGEYVVLDGAKALAIPTTYGQKLRVRMNARTEMHWQSLDKEGKVWFEARFQKNSFGVGKNYFSGTFNVQHKHEVAIAESLLEVLVVAQEMNHNFLAEDRGWEVVTQLDFPRDWGLGSSSTLINNIAQWAQVDAFQLLERTFGGSGYDIAAAQYDHPIFYQRGERGPLVQEVTLDWPFRGQLFFVHLNKKQNSRQGIQHYRRAQKNQQFEGVDYFHWG